MLKLLSIRSFKMKLLFIIWIGSTAALFLACGCFIFFQVAEFDKDLIKEMKIISNFIADKSAPAIMFNDPDIAEYALLSAAAIEPAIVNAVIYDMEENVVATYARDLSGQKDFAIPEPQQNTTFLKDAHLHLFSDIDMYSDRVGTVYMKAERNVLYERIQRYGVIVVGIMAVSLLFIVVISFFLQKLISTPVMALIASAKQVSEKKDYAIRVKKQSDDELGVLVDAFNEMLAQIQESENALRESEALFRSQFERGNIGIAITSVEKGWLRVNKRICTMFGYTEEEIMKLTWADMTHQDDLAPDAAQFNRMLAGEIEAYEMDKRFICKDGNIVWTHLNVSCFRNADRTVRFAIASLLDITERMEVEEQLRQSQKMEAIGTLAGGIAHDFNNILGGIIGYSELAQDDLPQESPVQEYLSAILKSSTRAKDLVRQILTFSRKSQEECIPILLYPLVKEVAKLLRSTIPTTIEIKQNIDEQSGMVTADPIQMHQVVMNLCTNAVHAMADGKGVLGISLSKAVLTKESANRYHDLSPGPYLELKITDTGTGIDTKIIPRIFEPFFTTKEKEKGTGMGLAVVHGIVAGHGGDITVESQLGKGTTFRILLHQVMEESINEQELSSVLPTGSERILFVDDESTLIDSGKKMLQSLGYTVTALNSSVEAFEIFNEGPDKFDLVITDQTMPLMTGYDLAKRLLETRPGIPVMLCTGYSETITPEQVEAAGIKAFVYKPISKKEIARAIREVLDK